MLFFFLLKFHLSLIFQTKKSYFFLQHHIVQPELVSGEIICYLQPQSFDESIVFSEFIARNFEYKILMVGAIKDEATFFPHFDALHIHCC